MNDFLGMDPVAVRNYADLLIRNSSSANFSLTDLAAKCAALDWFGADATHFKTESQFLLLNQLNPIYLQFANLAERLNQEIAQQELASSAQFTGITSVASLAAVAAATTSPKLLPKVGKANTGLGSKLGNLKPLYFLPPISITEPVVQGGALLAKILTGNPDLVAKYTTHGSKLVATTPYPNSFNPQHLADLVIQNAEAGSFAGGGPNAANIRILEVRTAAGERAYIVHIPPTQADISSDSGWDGSQGNARDWTSNVATAAGIETTAVKDVKAALMAAGIEPGAPIMLTGHSQGGLIASQLAGDPEFNSATGFNVTHVFTVGAPTQNFVPAHSNTQVLNVSHSLGHTDFKSAQQYAAPLAVASIGTATSCGNALLGNGSGTACLSSVSNLQSATKMSALDFSKDLLFTKVGFDPVPLLDFGAVKHEQVQEVAIAPPANHAGVAFGLMNPNPMQMMHGSHDSMRYLPDSSEIDMNYGYYPTVLEHQNSNEELSRFHQEITGLYVGDGVQVISDTNYQFVREPEPQD